MSPARVPVPLPSDSPWTLPALGRPALQVAVHGDPAPQGSKKYVGQRAGKAVLAESSRKVGPWRAAVAAAAKAAVRSDFEALDGPLVMDLVVTLHRPQDAARTGRPMATKYPDLSKLARSTEDALGTDAGLIADDARIVAYRRLDKVYERDAFDRDALRQPGAVIRLWRVPPALLGIAPPAAWGVGAA